MKMHRLRGKWVPSCVVKLRASALEVALRGLDKELSRYGVQALWIMEHNQALAPRLDQRWFIQSVREERRVHHVDIRVEAEPSAYDVEDVGTYAVLIAHSGKL